MLEPGLNATTSQKVVFSLLGLIIVGFLFHFIYFRMSDENLLEEGAKVLSKTSEVKKE